MSESVIDQSVAGRIFAKLFPEGIRLDKFDSTEFCVETRGLGGHCADRLRALAIWHGNEYPPSGIGGWRTLEVLYQYAATMSPADFRIPHSRGLAALEFAQLLGSGDESRQMYRTARRALEEALQVNPSSDDTMYLLGLSYYFDEECDTSEARQWFRRALDVNPTMARARLYLAHSLQDEAKWGDALSEYERVNREDLSSELQPWRVTRLMEQMGYCQMKLGHREEAVRLFDGVLRRYEEADPHNLPDDLVGYPSELIEAATSCLVDELFDRAEKCINRYGWESFYAQLLAKGREYKLQQPNQRRSGSDPC